jgi:hypothetical protein
MPEDFRRLRKLPERLWKLPERFWQCPERFPRCPEGFWELAERFPRGSEGFREPPEESRKRPEGLRKLPERVWDLPEELRRTFQPGQGGEEDRTARRLRRRDAHDEAAGGNKAVIGPEHGGAEAAHVLRAVGFTMGHGVNLASTA